MQQPTVRCKITAECDVLPSESPEKVRLALSNILPGADIRITKGTARASSSTPGCLERIFESIHSRKTQGAYMRRLRANMDDDSTWFYLNKQAAFAGVVSLCGGEDESPLGPIRIAIRSGDIEQVAGWLASR